ncbi:DUF4837 family protein [Catalinimonas alkaloidigena]|nr:DUF4837 family protein [Catalinimonas alkaloidigena]
MKHGIITFWIVLLAVLGACSTDESSSDLTKPVALGRAGDVLFVVDSTLWNGPVGKQLRTIFEQPMPGLPTDEAAYYVQRISPYDLSNRFQQQRRNLVFVHVFNDKSAESQRMSTYFGKDVRERVDSDSSFFLATEENKFARGQTVMYLFAPTAADLLAQLQENPQRILNRFRNSELKSIRDDVLKKENRSLERQLRNDYGFVIRLPENYKLALERDNFVWLRNMEAVLDRSIVIGWREYTSESQFSPDSVVAWRDQLGRYITGSDDTASYMVTETYIPPDFETTTFNGRYAVESRGLWKMNDNRLGGVFLSYTFVDDAQQRLYYVEGFIYAPNMDKREYLREMEALLQTFQPAKSQPDA